MKRVYDFILLSAIAFTAVGGTNGVAVVSEVRTFRLQYASAREVAEQINQLMAARWGLCDRFDIMGPEVLENK